MDEDPSSLYIVLEKGLFMNQSVEVVIASCHDHLVSTRFGVITFVLLLETSRGGYDMNREQDK